MPYRLPACIRKPHAALEGVAGSGALALTVVHQLSGTVPRGTTARTFLFPTGRRTWTSTCWGGVAARRGTCRSSRTRETSSRGADLGPLGQAGNRSGSAAWAARRAPSAAAPTGPGPRRGLERCLPSSLDVGRQRLVIPGVGPGASSARARHVTTAGPRWTCPPRASPVGARQSGCGPMLAPAPAPQGRRGPPPVRRRALG